jgi:hypothetical protein
MWKIGPKINIYTKIGMNRCRHVCNSGTILWNLGKEGKEKRMTEYQ